MKTCPACEQTVGLNVRVSSILRTQIYPCDSVGPLHRDRVCRNRGYLAVSDQGGKKPRVPPSVDYGMSLKDIAECFKLRGKDR